MKSKGLALLEGGSPTCVHVWSPDFSGHHFLYVRLLVESLATLAIPVSLHTQQTAVESSEFAVHLSGLAVILADARSLGECVQNAEQGSVVVVLHADNQMAELLRARVPAGVKLRALVMRPPRAIVSRRTRLLKNAGMVVLNLRRRVEVVELRSFFDSAESRFDQVPDPVLDEPTSVSKSEARENLGILLPDGAILGGLLGLITARKQSALLFQALDALGSNHHLLVAGTIGDPSTASALEATMHRHPGRVHVFDGYLSHEVFSNCLASVDYVAALHREKISSGVVLNAVARGTPVVVLRNTPLGRLVERVKVGCAVESTPSSVAAGVSAAVSLDPIKPRGGFPAEHDFVNALVGLTSWRGGLQFSSE